MENSSGLGPLLPSDSLLGCFSGGGSGEVDSLSAVCPNGNTCVVDPWSAAGLVTGILGVAATVLAILGAVAAAGWWVMLNNRVDDQVKSLYSKHKKEIGKKLDEYVAVQQREMNERLGTVQTNLQSIESRINGATTDIDKLEETTHKAEEMVLDGLMAFGAVPLEEWAKNAMTHPGFSKIPVKMAERYLHYIASNIDETETEVARELERLSADEQKYKDWAAAPPPRDPLAAWPQPDLSNIQWTLNHWLDRDTKGYHPTNRIFAYWEGALRWLAIAKDGHADAETLQHLEEKVEQYRPRLEHLKQDHEQLRERTSVLHQQISSLMKERGIFVIHN